jgi:hypothetical protein
MQLMLNIPLRCTLLVLQDKLYKSRVLVTLDAGLDWRIDLLDIHQAELQLIITLYVSMRMLRVCDTWLQPFTCVSGETRTAAN